MSRDAEAREIGPYENDPVLPMNETGRIHARNREHLAAYVRARRAHLAAGTGCSLEFCCGAEAIRAIRIREQRNPHYLIDLVFSAIVVISEQQDTIASIGAQSMGMELDLNALKAELTDVQRRLNACEDIVADDRAYRPKETQCPPDLSN
jgi:hypothetical protein